MSAAADIYMSGLKDYEQKAWSTHMWWGFDLIFVIQTEMFCVDIEITEKKEQILQRLPCVPCPSSKVGLAKTELHITNISHLEHFSTGTRADTEGPSEKTRTKEIEGLCTKPLRILKYSMFSSSSPEFFLWFPQQELICKTENAPYVPCSISVWKLRYKLGKGSWPGIWIRHTHSESV